MRLRRNLLRLVMGREARILELKEEVRRLRSLLGEDEGGVVSGADASAGKEREELACDVDAVTAERAAWALSLAEDAEAARLESERRSALLAHELSEQARTLRDARILSEMLFTHAPVGVVRLDARGCVESVNPAALQAFGYSTGELLGMPLHETVHAQRADGEQASDDECPVCRGVRTGQAELLSDHVFRRKDGGVFIANGIVAPVREGTDAGGAIVFFHDVTERRALEGNIDRLKQIERELQLTRSKAEEADRTKSSFLAGMSHEIRTPMNAVIGMSYLLRQSGLTAQQTDHMDKLQAAADELSRILNNILEFSTLRSEHVDPAHSAFSLAATVEESLGGLRERARWDGLDWRLAISPDMPDALIGDGPRLGLILSCLCSNAVKFTESGGVVVEFGREPSPDGVLLLHIRVRDTGIGMRPEQLEEVFQSFTQADGSLTRRHGGIGLGLTLCRHLVDLLGGRMWAESTVGQGSDFHCIVPVEAAVRHAAAAPEPAPVCGFRDDAGKAAPGLASEQAGEGPEAMPRVLLVEDNEINQEIACELLRDLHLDVEVAEDGEKALAAICAGRYDMVFMDIQMPVMDGLEATRRIRSSGLPWAEQVPIIAMTAHGLSDDRERSMAAGMNAHVTKPIDPQALRRIISTWLPGRHAAEREAAETGEASQNKKLQDLYGIKASAGIANVAGNTKLYFDLLRRFAAKYRDSQRELLALLENKDIESAVRLAHTIKGVAANLGAVHLADMAKKIETALGARETITPLIGPYTRELARVTQGIEQLTGDGPMPAAQAEEQGAHVNADAIPRILEALEELPMLMQTDWGQAQEKVESLADALEHTEAAEAYAHLRNALEEFDLADFTKASKALADRLR